MTDLLYKEKRSREEEVRQMQERAATMIKEMEKKLEALRGGTCNYSESLVSYVAYPNRGRSASPESQISTRRVQFCHQ